MRNGNTKKIARAGIIACLYVILSLITFPVASGAIQFRASEALTVLPLIFPESIFALAIGCMLSNLLTGCAPFDVIFGSVITLVAAAATFGIGKMIKSVPLKILFGGLFPVVLNAFLLPLIWLYCYGVSEYIYGLQALFLVVSQSGAVYALGTPLFLVATRLKKKGIRFFE